MTSPITLRSAIPQELPALSALCLRSKAYWGYDADFMTACVAELTLTQEDIDGGLLIVARIGPDPAGVAQLAYVAEGLEIDALFVDPAFIGTGCGRVLFDWCKAKARELGESVLRIEADPGAAGFYERMGARLVGEAPSGSIPGRMLPLFEFRLD